MHGFHTEVKDYEHLFSITNQHNRGRLKTNKSLKGFYGLWQIEIKASDQGLPQLSNTSLYEVYVKPHNFHTPEIVYPLKQQKSIRIW